GGGRGGVGKKPHDLQGAWSCSACHDACDGRSRDVDRATARQYHAEGVMRTQALLLNEGVLVA
ncbi:nuclease domain-containing protein, partial [Pseudomonas putida]|uniref:nuclease domain-containing protein n=1 Tax=Pseudomonas putida TaxID=303 RepID=UPI0018E6D0D2